MATHIATRILNFLPASLMFPSQKMVSCLLFWESCWKNRSKYKLQSDRFSGLFASQWNVSRIGRKCVFSAFWSVRTLQLLGNNWVICKNTTCILHLSYGLLYNCHQTVCYPSVHYKSWSVPWLYYADNIFPVSFIEDSPLNSLW